MRSLVFCIPNKTAGNFTNGSVIVTSPFLDDMPITFRFFPFSVACEGKSFTPFSLIFRPDALSRRSILCQLVCDPPFFNWSLSARFSPPVPPGFFTYRLYPNFAFECLNDKCFLLTFLVPHLFLGIPSMHLVDIFSQTFLERNSILPDGRSRPLPPPLF